MERVFVKRIFVTAFLTLLVSVSLLTAQSTEQFRHRLAVSDSYGRSNAVVVEQGDAATVVRRIEEGRRTQKIGGYRVRIFFDNSQDARPNANSTKNKFDEMFPDVPSYISYENPYWKITVGNCLSNEEAIILWGRVKNTFDRAFVIREDIELSELAREAREPIEQEEALRR